MLSFSFLFLVLDISEDAVVPAGLVHQIARRFDGDTVL
jgi:hypothetical protein